MPKVVDSKLRRQEITDACLLLFAECGYAMISMRQIASSLGVTTGLLYHYFPSKRDILNAILSQKMNQHQSAAQLFLSTVSGEHDQLIALCHFIDERATTMSALLMVAIDASRVGGEESQTIIQTVLSGYVDAISSLLGVSTEKANSVLDLAFGYLLRHAIGGNTLSLSQRIQSVAFL